MDQSNETLGISVHAGFPNPSEDHQLSSLDLNQLLIPRSVSTFLFHIDGREWERLGIFSGDIAIVDRALDPQVSDIVIWWHSSEFAISRVSDVPKGATRWGVVTAIIHRLRKQRHET